MTDIDDDNLDIYINNEDDFIEDELVTYLGGKRADKKVSQFTLNFKNNYILFFYNIFIYMRQPTHRFVLLISGKQIRLNSLFYLKWLENIYKSQLYRLLAKDSSPKGLLLMVN